MADRDPIARSAERFAREIANHQMTVMHDDGLYRHLAFRNREHGWNLWFDLITVPGALVFQGDGQSYVFHRVDDMFTFFRGPVGQINPHYWGEKIVSGNGRASIQTYRQEALIEHINEIVAERVQDDPETYANLAEAVRRDIRTQLIGDESLDRKLVEDFRFYANEDDEFAIPSKRPDFEFSDVWEWDSREYDWWFLWACNAIVWGIAQYDAARTPVAAAPVGEEQTT